jgi:chromatin segregation and condensation protein Rec8/ScpA/Scc1 (kleisin family)
LELSRRGVISLRQNELFSDIYIYLRAGERGQANVNSVS